MANAGNDMWSWLTTPGQNNIASFGGTPITVTGQPPISSLITGGLDLWSIISGEDRKNAQNILDIGYPLNKTTSEAQTQMRSFLQDPSSVLKDPAFTAAEGIGAENVARISGSAGMGSSGNKLADLFKYGTSFGLNYENQNFQQLLSLLTGSPQTAALEEQGTAGQNKTIGDLIASLFGGGGVPGLMGQLPQLAKLLGFNPSGVDSVGGLPGNESGWPGDTSGLAPGGAGGIGGLGGGESGWPGDWGDLGGDLGLNF